MALTATALENTMLSAGLVAGTTYYLSLHSASPSTTGANEFPSTGGYVRQAWVCAAASGGAVSNNAAIAVPNAGTTGATHFGLWTAATGGTYLTGAPLGATTTAASITFAIGAAAINLS